MNTSAKKITAALFGLGILALIIGLTSWGRSQIRPAMQIESPKEPDSQTDNASPSSPKIRPVAAVAPFIIRDTDTDSPGTNIVTRIVTMTAEVGGTPPPARQWKVDHGRGYEPLAGATNAIFRIGNAQILDSGFYSLFATNSAGSIQTTPQQLVVTEGED
jgi:hypothetical protein